jgi:hypothetical protein
MSTSTKLNLKHQMIINYYTSLRLIKDSKFLKKFKYYLG